MLSEPAVDIVRVYPTNSEKLIEGDVQRMDRFVAVVGHGGQG